MYTVTSFAVGVSIAVTWAGLGEYTTQGTVEQRDLFVTLRACACVWWLGLAVSWVGLEWLTCVAGKLRVRRRRTKLFTKWGQVATGGILPAVVFIIVLLLTRLESPPETEDTVFVDNLAVVTEDVVNVTTAPTMLMRPTPPPTGALAELSAGCVDDDAAMAVMGGQWGVLTCQQAVEMGSCQMFPDVTATICPVSCKQGCGAATLTPPPSVVSKPPTAFRGWWCIQYPLHPLC
jgi:hypothetical protein